MPKAAAIYARISQDRSGEAAGTKRQVDDCQRTADQLGWTVAEVYVDDDTSAYSGKRRPEYERMLTDIREGRRDAVLVWHMDRLHRRPKELEEFVEACDQARLRHVSTASGQVDLGTGDGLLVARITAAVAAAESQSKSRRQKRKMLELAEQGRPNGGMRPFGYEVDGRTVRPDEAAIVRTLAARLLAGESLRSLTIWLNDEAVPTVTGRAQWRPIAVKTILRSGRISGQREYHGQILGRAQWPAIIDPEQTARIRGLFEDPSRRTNRTARRYLLTGLLRCGHCGERLLAAPKQGTRRYGCRPGPTATNGCGRIYVAAEPLEQWIAAAVLMRLDGPQLADHLAGRAPDDTATRDLREAIDADERLLAEVADLHAQRRITTKEWLAQRDPIAQRIAETRSRLLRAAQAEALEGYIGNGAALQERWHRLNLDQQRAIVTAVLDHATIGPAKPGNRFNPDRVTPAWHV